jgi:Putative polyhydroxyalkanoic acid system protein (PHA_gran_rgn)
MPDLTVTVPHRLTQEEALNRIKRIIASAKKQYAGNVSDLQESWNGYIGTFKVSARGFSGSGDVTVGPTDVTLQLTLPFAAMLLKGQIESTIREQVSRLLG